MTARERVQQERPCAFVLTPMLLVESMVARATTAYLGLVNGLCQCDLITKNGCTSCWNQQIPETENIEKESKNMKKTKAELEQELIEKQTEILNLNKELDNLNRYKKYEDCANELKGALDAMMDAGFTRTEAMSILLASAKM